MADLHVLFVAGALVHRAGLAAMPVSGALGFYLLGAGRRAREAATARATMPLPARFEAGAAGEVGREVCVDGVLAGPAGARVYGWSGAPARDAEGGLVLRVGEDTLAFAAPVEVVAGARVTAFWMASRLARRLGLDLDPEDTFRFWQARLLGPGDRVRVHGRVARVPEASRYRDVRATLAIEPPPGAAAVRVASLRRPRLVAWPPTRWALGAMLGLAAWALLFLAGGALALTVARGALPRQDDGVRLSAAALAAATPWRDEALGVVASYSLFEGQLDRAEEAYRLLDDCDGQVSVILRRGRVEAAIERADACGIPVPAEALFAVGRFEQACHDWDHGERSVARAEACLCAGDVDETTLAVDQMASSNDPRSDAFLCVGYAINARNGHTGARMALNEKTGNPVCRLLLADISPSNRRALLHDAGGPFPPDLAFASRLFERTAQALLEETDPGAGFWPSGYGGGLLAAQYRDLWTRAPGVAPFDLTQELVYPDRPYVSDHPWALYSALLASGRGGARDPEEVRVHLAGHLALFLAAAGDPDGAYAALRKVDPGVASGPPWSLAPIWAISDFIRTNADVHASSERRFALRGALGGALDEAVRRAAGAGPDAAGARESAARLRAVMLDREIAVPLLVLEAFARQ